MEKIMNINEINDLWEKDLNIDINDLGHESLQTPKLHNKYYNLLIRENKKYENLVQQLNSIEQSLNLIYSGKADAAYYKQNPIPELITKTNIQKYIQTHPEHIKLSSEMFDSKQILLYLEEIIKNIHARQWTIRNAIDWKKFLNGN